MECSLCKKEAIIYFPHSKKLLCGEHLSQSVEKKVGNTIRKYGMIQNKRRIGVGVSGGKDSLTLLYILNKILGENRNIEIICITIDEGIEKYRDTSIKKVKKMCNELNIEHRVFSFKEYKHEMDRIMKKEKSDQCSYCGVFRRWILNKKCKELDIDVLAIGHNLDDTIQTFQMNIMRNEPERIVRFKPVVGEDEGDVFIPRIRPLFNVSEREIITYAIYNNIDFYSGECPYAGKALRNPVRKFINDMENEYPGIKHRMLRSYLYILENGININKKELRECILCNEKTTGEICKRCELIKKI